MTSNSFCDACGAALATAAEVCPVCGKVQQTAVLAPQQPSLAPALQPGFLLKERYRIVQQIGAGGFGLVYQAVDMRLRPDRSGNRPLVAIKQITLAALNAQQMIEATASYNREIMLLPSLKHTNIPQLYDHFTDPEHWYLVLQYIKGQTLEEILAREPGGRLSGKKALRIGIELCTVLGYLHTQNPPIIFRDVKPANVMLTPRGKVYLIDFGIARRYRDGQGRDTVPLGSPGYAAPEQYGKAQTTPRTDVYGLGATLQTLLTGKEPWEIRAHGPPVDCPIPADLRSLIEKMLEHDSNRRPASAASVLQALKAVQNKYYPSFVPTAWLIGLWTLFWLITSIIFANIPFDFFHWLLFYLGARAMFYFYKTMRKIPGRLTRSNVRDILMSIIGSTGTYAALGCPMLFFFIVLTSALPHFLLPQVVVLPICLICWLAGMLMVSRGWWPSFKRARQGSGTAQSQQAVQMPPIVQQARTHPHEARSASGRNEGCL